METYLEHCILNWTVQNNSCFEHSYSEYVESPTFYLEKSLTSWKLSITSNGTKGVSLCLSRRGDDEGSKVIHVSYKFSLENNNGNIFTCKNLSKSFLRSTSRTLNVSNVDVRNLLKSQNSSLKDELKVLCEMFIFLHRKRSKNYFDGDCESSIDLSVSFESFYKSRAFCDVTLRTPEGELEAHKSILVARSAFFRRKLKSSSELEFLLTPIGALKKIVLYMYTGKFQFSVLDRSYIFTIVDLLGTFQLELLRELLFSPNEMYGCTEVVLENYEFTWVIKEFGSYEKCSCIKSPRFKTNDEVWFLMIYPKGCKTFNVELEVSNLKRKIRAEVNLAIKISSETPCNTKEKLILSTIQKMECDGPIQFSGFSERKFNDTLKERLVPNDTLALSASLTISQITEISAKSSLVKSIALAEPYNLQQKLWNSLSEDFYKLFKTRYESDVFVKAGEYVFKAHKAVLIARSSIFRTIMENQMLQPNWNGVLILPLSEPKRLKYLLRMFYGANDK